MKIKFSGITEPSVCNTLWLFHLHGFVLEHMLCKSMKSHWEWISNVARKWWSWNCFASPTLFRGFVNVQLLWQVVWLEDVKTRVIKLWICWISVIFGLTALHGGFPSAHVWLAPSGCVQMVLTFSSARTFFHLPHRLRNLKLTQTLLIFPVQSCCFTLRVYGCCSHREPIETGQN